MIAELPVPEKGLAYEGHAEPRIAPPVPLWHRASDIADMADTVGFPLMPWQINAAKYLTACDERNTKPTYREIAIVVARQNGKSTLLIPLILDALMHGRRVMHTAQNRRLPVEVFSVVVHELERRGKVRKVIEAYGRETVTTTNGATYRIVAPTREGARGPTNDMVIIDELRVMEDWTFIGAAKPTLIASKSAQMVYLSNAGTSESVVLNAVRARAHDDPNLAYLEWSAEPERRSDDVTGWMQSNPSIGHGPIDVESLQAEYTTNKLQGTLGIFEVENLCRWVDSLAPKFVPEGAWMQLYGKLEEPRRPFMAVSMDPSGTRASGVIAWRMASGRVGVRVVADVTGQPIDTDALGADMKKLALKLGVAGIAYDPWTDTDLARKLPRAKSLAGRDFAVACENFTRRVSDGSLMWDEAEQVTTDLGWTTRKSHETGAFHAVKSSEEHTITAALAAIRAVWLATSEKPPAPKVL